MSTRPRPQTSESVSGEEIVRPRTAAIGPRMGGQGHAARPGVTVDQVKVPMALPLVVSAAAVTAALLFYLTRRFDFFSDEWTFILSYPNWVLKSYFEPHNEHWSTLLMAWYKLGFSLFGLRSYHFFMAGVLLTDAAVATLLFLIIRRRSGEMLAMAAAAVMLVLGNGWEEILWGFQIGWAGA